MTLTASKYRSVLMVWLLYCFNRSITLCVLSCIFNVSTLHVYPCPVVALTSVCPRCPLPQVEALSVRLGCRLVKVSPGALAAAAGVQGDR